MGKKSFLIRPWKKGEENYVADAHERIYVEEYGWNENFYKYAKQIACDFGAAPRKPREELWIAEMDGAPAGCVMLVGTDDPNVAQLRLFLVEKAARKQGIGSALVQELLKKAREWGYKRIILWTAEPLHDARRYYGKLGFTMTERNENHDWRGDGGAVAEEKWEMEL